MGEDTQTYRQHGNRISIIQFFFFQNKQSRLMKSPWRLTLLLRLDRQSRQIQSSWNRQSDSTCWIWDSHTGDYEVYTNMAAEKTCRWLRMCRETYTLHLQSWRYTQRAKSKNQAACCVTQFCHMPLEGTLNTCNVILLYGGHFERNSWQHRVPTHHQCLSQLHKSHHFVIDRNIQI
jgi:hypothetical protein